MIETGQFCWPVFFCPHFRGTGERTPSAMRGPRISDFSELRFLVKSPLRRFGRPSSKMQRTKRAGNTKILGFHSGSFDSVGGRIFFSGGRFAAGKERASVHPGTQGFSPAPMAASPRRCIRVKAPARETSDLPFSRFRKRRDEGNAPRNKREADLLRTAFVCRKAEFFTLSPERVARHESLTGRTTHGCLPRGDFSQALKASLFFRGTDCQRHSAGSVLRTRLIPRICAEKKRGISGKQDRPDEEKSLNRR